MGAPRRDVPDPISRFYRDKGVFDTLAEHVLTSLAEAARQRGDHVLRIWSAEASNPGYSIDSANRTPTHRAALRSEGPGVPP
jgi:hypothetical protein